MSREKIYKAIEPHPYYPVKLYHDGTFHQPKESEAPELSISDIEKRTVRDTSFLINALDGRLDSDLLGKHFLDGKERYEGPCDAAIYLDKSARPVRALVSEFWDKFSDRPKPPHASFLNIDKINYLLEMGFTKRDIQERSIGLEEISLDKMDEKFVQLRTAEIRALYIKNRKLLPEIEQLIQDVQSDARSPDELDVLWQYPTFLDDKHVAIVDEVKSSGATLSIADQLLQRSFPDARFEPLFWSTPPTLTYDIELPDGRVVKGIADTEKPLWYNSKTSDGRGGIGNVNFEKAARSRYALSRIGKHIIGVPYAAENNGRVDRYGNHLRQDFKTMRLRLDSGEIAMPPDGRRWDN